MDKNTINHAIVWLKTKNTWFYLNALILNSLYPTQRVFNIIFFKIPWYKISLHIMPLNITTLSEINNILLLNCNYFISWSHIFSCSAFQTESNRLCATVRFWIFLDACTILFIRVYFKYGTNIYDTEINNWHLFYLKSSIKKFIIFSFLKYHRLKYYNNPIACLNLLLVLVPIRESGSWQRWHLLARPNLWDASYPWPLNCQVPKVLPTAEAEAVAEAEATLGVLWESRERSRFAAHLLRLCQYLATDLHEIINRI